MASRAAPARPPLESALTAGAARYLTPAEVADLLQINEDTVKAHARAGKIPAKRIGKFFRFHPRLIDEWMLAGDDS